jgi:hypothetical protein
MIKRALSELQTGVESGILVGPESWISTVLHFFYV